MLSRDAAIADKLGRCRTACAGSTSPSGRCCPRRSLELKDPRIGFVTVTGVDTSPDLRQATVFVSVLGGRAQAGEDAWRGSARRTACCRPRIARELRLKRTPQLTFEYDQSVERGVRMTQLIDELAPDDRRLRRLRRRLEHADLAAVVEAIRVARPLPRHDAREPRRRRARVAARVASRAASGSARRASCSCPGRRRCRASTGSCALDELLRALPADAGERVARSPSTARTRAGSAPTRRCSTPRRYTINVDHHHDNSRFGDVNLVVADASSTAEVLRDVMRELGVELTPGARRAVVRRARHRHRPVPVHEHDAEGAAARRRARRGRRGRAQGLPGRLRDGSVREAEAARAGARAGTGLRGRRARRLLPAARRLRRGRGGRAVLGGDHRLPARGRGRGHGGADPRAAARRQPGAAGLAARVARRARRLGDRAQAGGGGHRQAAGFSSDDSIEGITAFLVASSPRSRPTRADAAARRWSRAGSSSSTSRRGRRRSRSSPACVRGRGTRMGHAGTLDPFATGLLLLLSGRSTRLAGSFVGLDKRYLTDVDLTARTSTGDPEGEVVERLRGPGAATSSSAGSRPSAVRSSCRSRPPPRSRSAASAPTSCTAAASTSRCRCGARGWTRSTSSRIRTASSASTSASARARTSGRSPRRSAATASPSAGWRSVRSASRRPTRSGSSPPTRRSPAGWRRGAGHAAATPSRSAPSTGCTSVTGA